MSSDKAARRRARVPRSKDRVRVAAGAVGRGANAAEGSEDAVAASFSDLSGAQSAAMFSSRRGI